MKLFSLSIPLEKRLNETMKTLSNTYQKIWEDKPTNGNAQAKPNWAV